MRTLATSFQFSVVLNEAAYSYSIALFVSILWLNRSNLLNFFVFKMSDESLNTSADYFADSSAETVKETKNSANARQSHSYFEVIIIFNQ